MTSTKLEIGVMSGFGSPHEARHNVEYAEKLGFDSLWVGDHVAFPVPILDSLTQLALAAGFAEKIHLGTCVYLLPLRHPTTVAKQVSTLDRLLGGRLVFGVGVGGEFPNEYAACGIPVQQRGARLSEGIEVLKALWSGEKVSHSGQFYPFQDVQMLPTPANSGGPPIWCGGRSQVALKRAGLLADGYVSYAVDATMYREALKVIDTAGHQANRDLDTFQRAHMLFMRIEDGYEGAHRTATEHLSRRYAMDFSKPAKRYAALGTPEDVAAVIEQFRQAGASQIILDLTGPLAERDEQLQRFAEEVRPLLT
ncbi:MAG: LLM class flavin-dependent oxidoreductase [bacterium]